MLQNRFPIAYWGSISYYQLLIASGNVVVELYETYPKQTYRNRCTILTASGVLELSIPVNRVNGSKTLTKDIEISNTQDWQKVHWRAIKSAYASSPFFDHYSMEIEELLFSEHRFLVDFNQQIQERICQWLDLPIIMQITDDFYSNYQNDLLHNFEKRIPKGDYNYQQVFTSKENFEPDLTILDALMNLGPMARKLLIK